METEIKETTTEEEIEETKIEIRAEISTETLKHVVERVKVCTDEAILLFREWDIYVPVVNPEHTEIVAMTIPVDSMRQYYTNGIENREKRRLAGAVEIKQLEEVVKMAGKEETVRIDYIPADADDKKQREMLKFTVVNSRGKKSKTLLFRVRGEDPTIPTVPTLEYAEGAADGTLMSMDKETVKDFLTMFKKVEDPVVLHRIDNDTIAIESEDENKNKTRMEIPRVVRAGEEGRKVMIDTKYLFPSLKALKDEDGVILHIRDDYPLKITWENEYESGAYMIAPRIED